ncbi:hypothetical protein CEXT_321161 [Caerostris extrusa]|uniref:Uncharacterized protein n=1 Tax=Caerostris extrusa TaxID=172846 RepID=A0AAV4VQV5_CAEEX|nr:hypothetical protein CEXT_321161 [Caerostris extrusa]
MGDGVGSHKVVDNELAYRKWCSIQGRTGNAEISWKKCIGCMIRALPAESNWRPVSRKWGGKVLPFIFFHMSSHPGSVYFPFNPTLSHGMGRKC